MGAPKGHPKYGGRKKGTPNKNKVFSVSSRLSEMGIDLIGEILNEIEQLDKPFLKVKCYFQLLEYCDAKRKAIEVTDNTDAAQEAREKISNMPMAELKMLVKNQLKEDDE